MQTEKMAKPEKQLGRGTSLPERQAAMRARLQDEIRNAKANREKAKETLRIKLAD
jgi:hypothetical protein